MIIKHNPPHELVEAIRNSEGSHAILHDDPADGKIKWAVGTPEDCQMTMKTTRGICIMTTKENLIKLLEAELLEILNDACSTIN